MENPKVIIDGVKVISDLTGEVHELQLENLKRYPFVVMDGLKSCTVDITIGDATTQVDADSAGDLCRRPRPIAIEYLLESDGGLGSHTDELRAVWGRGAEILLRFAQTWFAGRVTIMVLVDGYRIEAKSNE